MPLCACIRASPFNLSSVILVLDRVLRQRRDEKLCSSDPVLAGKVDNIFNKMNVHGYNNGSQYFKVSITVSGILLDGISSFFIQNSYHNSIYPLNLILILSFERDKCSDRRPPNFSIIFINLFVIAHLFENKLFKVLGYNKCRSKISITSSLKWLTKSLILLSINGMNMVIR